MTKMSKTLRRVRRIVVAVALGPDHGAHCACCASARPRAATVRTAASVRPPVDLLPPVPVRCRRRVGLHLVRLERRRAEEAAERCRNAATASAHPPRLAAAVDAAIAADTARARWRGVPVGDGLDDLRADLAPLLRHLIQQQRRGVAA